MKVLVIQAHPNPNSFSAAIAERLKLCLELLQSDDASMEIILHALYQEEFFPVLPLEELKCTYCFDPAIQSYIDNVRQADVFIFIHPDWWGQPPAILKGWLDRIFRCGVAYDYRPDDFDENVPLPLLTGKKAMAIITSNLAYSSKNQQYFEDLWAGRVFAFCGLHNCGVKVCYDMSRSTHGERARWLENLAIALPALLQLG